MKAKWILACVLLSSSVAVAAPVHKKHHHARTAHAAHVAKASHPAKLAHARKTGDEGQLRLASAVAMIVDQSDASVIYSHNAGAQAPIASITKLMTAMVVLDGALDMNEPITVTEDDVDSLRNSSSRLRAGQLPCRARKCWQSDADGVGEPRGRGAGAHLSGRHRALRRGHEPHGRPAQYAQHPLYRPHRPAQRKRVHRRRPGQNGPRRLSLSRDSAT